MTLRGSLVWQALGPIGEDYTAFVHVLDSNGTLLGQSDWQPLAGRYPTSVWRPGEYILDAFEIRLPAGVAADQCRVIAGMYLLRTQERLETTGGVDAKGGHIDLGEAPPDR